MAKQVLILGAGFAGLELATRLSESEDDVSVTLIDASPSFTFGFAKLAVMFGDKGADDVKLDYADISKAGVEFRQERVTSIDPAQRRVETDGGSYDADILAIALGADYDLDATAGLAEAGSEFYTLAGAERMRDAIRAFESGRVVIGILGHPYKCPPAPFEAAFLLHDHLAERGILDRAEIKVVGPMEAPVPITKEVSARFLKALAERDIPYVPKQRLSELDAAAQVARSADGEEFPYDLFMGVPVHRPPQVVRDAGLAPDDWIPVDKGSLQTEFEGVYALGDVAGTPNAKAGVFAESAAAAVAEDIAATLSGGELVHPNEGAGHCWLEFGGGEVARVEANFFGGPKPTAQFVGPSTELAAEKREFAQARVQRWFGS